MNDKLPFELGPENQASPEAPSAETTPPFPFLGSSDPAPSPFHLDASERPALPFSLDDDEPPAFVIGTPSRDPSVSLPPFADPEPPRTAVPFSFEDDSPAFVIGTPSRDPADALAAFNAEAQDRPALPFSLDDIDPLPFTQAAKEPAIDVEPEAEKPALPFSLDDVDPLPFAPANVQPMPPAERASESGPASHIPAMPPVAKSPTGQLPTMPPVHKTGNLPPSMERKVPPAEPEQAQPTRPRMPEAAPEPPKAERPATPLPVDDAPTLPPTRHHEHVTGAAIPTHQKPPMATDVSSALEAMKDRLAKARKAQLAEVSSILKSEAAMVEVAADVPGGTAKPPEIWNYRVGQAVFREGELTYELFMLMEGIVDIYVGNEKVASIDAATAAGAYIGEIGALLRLPRTATVKAVTSCKFLVFPDARRLFEEDPEFGIKLSTILALRLAKSNEHIDLVMRALYRAKVKDSVIDAVKGAFQGKESTYIGKKGWFS